MPPAAFFSWNKRLQCWPTGRPTDQLIHRPRCSFVVVSSCFSFKVCCIVLYFPSLALKPFIFIFYFLLCLLWLHFLISSLFLPPPLLSLCSQARSVVFPSEWTQYSSRLSSSWMSPLQGSVRRASYFFAYMKRPETIMSRTTRKNCTWKYSTTLPLFSPVQKCWFLRTSYCSRPYTGCFRHRISWPIFSCSIISIIIGSGNALHSALYPCGSERLYWNI